MRVVAGTLRGRRIESPEGTTTRPTTDMAREAIFNSLGSHYDLTGTRIVDCFAGTGALGIEALSRGAGHVTFIERDKSALDVLRENLQTLGLVDRSTVLRGDALTKWGSAATPRSSWPTRRTTSRSGPSFSPRCRATWSSPNPGHPSQPRKDGKFCAKSATDAPT